MPPATETPSIDVLIVTTNAREMVLSCLEHLGRQTVPHAVYLADNAGNADGTSDAVRTGFPDVHVLTSDENLGFSKGVNRLASMGDGAVIVLANDDMNVEPRFLEELIAPFTDERIGMVAGLTFQPGEADVVDGFGLEVDCTLMAYNRLRHHPPTDTPGRLLGPSGGAAAYRRSAWEPAGGMDQRYFVYGQDVDLALRLRLAGWGAAAAASARGVHLGGATTRKDSPFQRRDSGFARAFTLRRYGVLRGRHAPRAILIELLTVAYGALAARTLIPLRARIDGWRAAGGEPQLPIPAGAVNPSISLRESLRRLRYER
jgi:N-acetylglucosaminyl-diphospho-decaprenol L-rhamnosyltransferase